MLKLALIAAVATTAFSAAAHAGAACGKRDDVLAQLSVRYKEAPVGIGLAGNGGLIELLTSSAGSTWTLIITLPNGPTCLLGAGQNWESLQTAVADGPSI